MKEVSEKVNLIKRFKGMKKVWITKRGQLWKGTAASDNNMAAMHLITFRSRQSRR